eukprot:5253845-Alexandrium_andersonii.AAC.1
MAASTPSNGLCSPSIQSQHGRRLRAATRGLPTNLGDRRGYAPEGPLPLAALGGGVRRCAAVCG